MPEPTARVLERMGFIIPTPVQQATIPVVLSRKDVLVTAQTGTGKTGAFGLPLLLQLAGDPVRQALILVPTRELAAQIFGVLRQMAGGLKRRGVLVTGGESFRRQVDDIERGFSYLVATPGRLWDHLEQRTVDLTGTDMLVLDEVDRMMDMGFLPQVKRIVRHVPRQRQTMVFSATMPDTVLSAAESFLREPVRIAIGSTSILIPKIEETMVHTTPDKKNAVVLSALKERRGLVLVFARTKSRADRLARFIYQNGHDVALLHGGRSQPQRKRALESFRSGVARVMVATDLAGRGIDVPEIEHVINYDIPLSREDYIHRIGRTGRCGKEGHALNLMTGSLDEESILTGVARPGRLVYSTGRWSGRRGR